LIVKRVANQFLKICTVVLFAVQMIIVNLFDVLNLNALKKNGSLDEELVVQLVLYVKKMIIMCAMKMTLQNVVQVSSRLALIPMFVMLLSQKTGDWSNL
jgi:hypothetical protein